MSSAEWELNPESKASVLDPWLNQEPDPLVRERVLEWLAEFVRDPFSKGREENPGIWFAQVPGTRIGVMWVLDTDNRRVSLATVGPVD